MMNVLQPNRELLLKNIIPKMICTRGWDYFSATKQKKEVHPFEKVSNRQLPSRPWQRKTRPASHRTIPVPFPPSLVIHISDFFANAPEYFVNFIYENILFTGSSETDVLRSKKEQSSDSVSSLMSVSSHSNGSSSPLGRRHSLTS